MGKFVIYPEKVKKDSKKINDGASKLGKQSKKVQEVRNQNIFGGSQYSEIQESLDIIVQSLEHEQKYSTTLYTGLGNILAAYEKADNNSTQKIAKTGLTGTTKFGNTNNNNYNPGSSSYADEVNRVMDKLTDKNIPWQERLAYLAELLVKMSPLDPTKCTLTKAEKEAILRVFGPYFDKFTTVGKAATLTGEFFHKALFHTFLNTDPANAVEKAIIDSVAPQLAFLFGFTYNPATDSYYTQEGSNQQNWGFCDQIDEWGPALGMDLDTDVTTFTYDGQEFRIQLWKGNYGWGGSVGGEFAVYQRPESEALDNPYEWGSENSKYILFDSAENEYQPQIKQTVSYTDANGIERVFECDTESYGDGDDYWNLAIRSDSGVNKDTIHTQCVIDCSKQGEGYAQAMYEAFKNDPNLQGEPKIEGTTVTIEY